MEYCEQVSMDNDSLSLFSDRTDELIDSKYRPQLANQAKHIDGFSVAASPPLQSCACWRR